MSFLWRVDRRNQATFRYWSSAVALVPVVAAIIWHIAEAVYLLDGWRRRAAGVAVGRI